MSDMPWVRFFPSDWLGGTRGMSAAETGVYISLVAMMYERAEPIVEDHARLARLCGASNSQFKKALETLVSEGKIQRIDGKLWSHRVEKETVYRSEKSEVAKQAAETRWRKDKQNQEPSYADAMRPQCDGNAIQKPDTRNKERTPPTPSKPRAAPVGAESDLFERFWDAYPKRKGSSRKSAEQKFRSALKRGADPEIIIAGAARYAREREREDPQFTKHAETWLNKECWAEYAAQPAQKAVQTFDAEAWRARLNVARERNRWDRRNWGPAPYEPGCAVPQSLLSEADKRLWQEWFEAA